MVQLYSRDQKVVRCHEYRDYLAWKASVDLFRADDVETYLHAPKAFEMKYPFTAEIETTFETFVEYDRNVPAGIGKKAIVKFLKVY